MNRKKIQIIILTVIAIIVIPLGYYIHLNSEKPYFSTGFNIRMALDVESPLINTDEILSESHLINITILGKETISINQDRLNGNGELERWELNEIDAILSSMKGVWQIDQYVGFVIPGIYYYDLFDENSGLDENIRTQLYQMYDEKVESAKHHIPDIRLSIKEGDGKEAEHNYIYVNNVYFSPIKIFLSTERQVDYYLSPRDRTAIANEFNAKYPVFYIQFLVAEYKDDDLIEYTPTTLVITADKRFMVLIDGAYYSLKEVSKA